LENAHEQMLGADRLGPTAPRLLGGKDQHSPRTLVEPLQHVGLRQGTSGPTGYLPRTHTRDRGAPRLGQGASERWGAWGALGGPTPPSLTMSATPMPGRLRVWGL